MKRTVSPGVCLSKEESFRNRTFCAYYVIHITEHSHKAHQALKPAFCLWMPHTHALHSHDGC